MPSSANADAEKARIGAACKQAAGIVRRLERRQLVEPHLGRLPQHVGAVGAEHEGGGGAGHRIGLGILIGGGADEGDRAGQPIAMRVGADRLAGRRRAEIIDPQIQRGDGADARGRQLHRHAAALVQHAGHHAAMHHAGGLVADEHRMIGQAAPGLPGLAAIELKPDQGAVQRAPMLENAQLVLERQSGHGGELIGHGDTPPSEQSPSRVA